MATSVIGRRGFTTMQGVIDLMYVCNICPDLLSIDSGRMTGNSEVIHLDEKRAFRRSDPFGVSIRAATRESSRIFGDSEVISEASFLGGGSAPALFRPAI